MTDDLKKALGWPHITGLGVAIVISGNFAGWNYGLGLGGWGGLFLATCLMAVMYVGLVLCLSELSAAMPSAGGFYTFVERAFGSFAGYIVGMAVMAATVIASGAIAVFIGAYCQAVFGIGGWPVQFSFFAIFIGIHLWGVGEALGLLMIIASIAMLTLLTFIGAMLPHFSIDNLLTIPVTDAVGANPFLPFGFIGVWACIPFSIWFFIGIEHTTLAAEETHEPHKNIPRGMIIAMLILFVLAILVLLCATGGGGAQTIARAEDPLFQAMISKTAFGKETRLSSVIGLVAISGLVASFFSAIFAYSRQIFALARAGLLPKFLAQTSQRKVPIYALILPGIIGFGLSLTNPENLILIGVFLLTLTYLVVLASHIVLRKKEPKLERPYKTPGGIFTVVLTWILAAIAALACLLVNPKILIGIGALYLIFIVAFFLMKTQNKARFHG